MQMSKEERKTKVNGSGRITMKSHKRATQVKPCGTVSVEQCSGCSMETWGDTVHFPATTQGLSVPHLMCRRTEGTSTTIRHCCGVFRDSGARYRTANLLTYLEQTTKDEEQTNEQTDKHTDTQRDTETWRCASRRYESYPVSPVCSDVFASSGNICSHL